MVTDKGYVDVGFWHASQKGLITAAGDSGPRFEPAVETAIASVGPKNKEGVVTATRTLGGQLKLIVWEDDERGDLVPRPTRSWQRTRPTAARSAPAST